MQNIWLRLVSLFSNILHILKYKLMRLSLNWDSVKSLTLACIHKGTTKLMFPLRPIGYKYRLFYFMQKGDL